MVVTEIPAESELSRARRREEGSEPEAPRPVVGAARRRPGAWASAVLVLALLALAFQGTRGLWEPDEGYYVNPALAMMRSGDWLLPRLNGDIFLDKPPLVYWSIAAGMTLVGANEWGARLGHSLWFLLAALVVGQLGAEWWGRRVGITAALVYATTLLPALAANFLTPDTILAFAVPLSWWCGWRLLTAGGARPRALWGLALGAAVGLGGLAKGPAVLVFAAPLGIHLLLHLRPARLLVAPALLAVAVFLLVALPWYLHVVASVPGAAAYFLDNQILGRLVGERYERNPGWLGGFRVYLPTLLVGALPWSLFWPRWLRRSRPPRLAAWLRRLPTRQIASALALWFALPLAVFFLASSRLPLYVLPLFAPLALATSRLVTAPGSWLGSGLRPRAAVAAALWIGGLIVAKGLLAVYPYEHDARRLAADLRAADVPTTSFVIGLDMKANGLVLYGFRELEQVTNGRDPYPFYRPPEHLSVEIRELLDDGRGREFVVGAKNLEELERSLSAVGEEFTIRKLDRVPYWLVATRARDFAIP